MGIGGMFLCFGVGFGWFGDGEGVWNVCFVMELLFGVLCILGWGVFWFWFVVEDMEVFCWMVFLDWILDILVGVVGFV